MRSLRIDKYIITEPLINIINYLRTILTNGKLKDIRPRTDDIVVTCPYHSNGREANPDCNIYIGEDLDIPFGFTRCFACDFKGPFYHFVAECFNSSDDFAKNWLIQNYGKLAADTIELDDYISLNNTKKVNYLDESILDTYQHWTPYLAKRHLDADICEKLKVRYDPKFRQVIFPIYDIKGHLKMLAKRSIDTKTFYLDKNQEKEVYGLNLIQKNNLRRCLLVEGPIDMITSYSHKVPAIALLGTPSMYQVNEINNSCIEVIDIATDSDEAGNKFAEFLDKNISSRIIKNRVIMPPGKKDVNDLDSAEWQKLILDYNLNQVEF